MTRIGVITGISREADCLAVFATDRRPAVACSGASSGRALTLARGLIAGGCRALVSFGIAGGLRAGLAPGTVVVGETIVAPDGRTLETSVSWRAAVVAACSSEVVVAPVAGAERIVGEVAEKQALAARTGAAVVDMESHAVAAAAAEAGVPLLVVRAVADAAERRLPLWMATCVADDGSRRWGRVAAGVVRHPADLPVLLALAADSGKALAALSRVAGRAGPLFSLP